MNLSQNPSSEAWDMQQRVLELKTAYDDPYLSQAYFSGSKADLASKRARLYQLIYHAEQGNIQLDANDKRLVRNTIATLDGVIQRVEREAARRAEELKSLPIGDQQVMIGLWVHLCEENTLDPNIDE